MEVGHPVSQTSVRDPNTQTTLHASSDHSIHPWLLQSAAFLALPRNWVSAIGECVRANTARECVRTPVAWRQSSGRGKVDWKVATIRGRIIGSSVSRPSIRAIRRWARFPHPLGLRQRVDCERPTILADGGTHALTRIGRHRPARQHAGRTRTRRAPPVKAWRRFRQAPQGPRPAEACRTLAEGIRRPSARAANIGRSLGRLAARADGPRIPVRACYAQSDKARLATQGAA